MNYYWVSVFHFIDIFFSHGFCLYNYEIFVQSKYSWRDKKGPYK